jgi:hypothetical protein
MIRGQRRWRCSFAQGASESGRRSRTDFASRRRRGEDDFSQEREAGFADERSLIGEAATGAGGSQPLRKTVVGRVGGFVTGVKAGQITSEDFFGAISGGIDRESIPAHHVAGQVENEKRRTRRRSYGPDASAGRSLPDIHHHRASLLPRGGQESYGSLMLSRALPPPVGNANLTGGSRIESRSAGSEDVNQAAARKRCGFSRARRSRLTRDSRAPSTQGLCATQSRMTLNYEFAIASSRAEAGVGEASSR